MRSIVLALVGWLSVSSCAAHVEPRCSERAVQRESKPAPAGDDAASGTSEVAGAGSATDRLAGAVLGGIPRPKAGQFDTPERVLGFLVKTLASRNIAESLAAFPIVEYAERVTLKDRIEFTYSFSPNSYPLDDDRYARLTDAAAGYLSQYSLVAELIYGDETNPHSPPPGDDAGGVLHEFDGPPLAVKIASIEEVRSESAPQLSSIERALGVTEKRFFKVIVTLDQRRFDVISSVGRIDENWRVLLVSADP